MPELASVNGVVTLLSEARVSIRDRGFLSGDAAYEVVRVYAGRPFRLRDHLGRMESTLRGLRFAVVPPAADVEAACLALVRKSGLSDALLHLHVTRGVAATHMAVPLASYTHPTVVLSVQSLVPLPAELYHTGISVITVRDVRWAKSNLKTVNLIPRTLVLDDALAAGAFEAIWVDEDDNVCEGLSTNVFAFVDDALVTPPLTEHILAGITRDTILDIARAQGIPVREVPISRAALFAAQEVFVASSVRELLPVVQIDGQPVGGGDVGFRTPSLHVLFKARTAPAEL